MLEVARLARQGLDLAVQRLQVEVVGRLGPLQLVLFGLDLGHDVVQDLKVLVGPVPEVVKVSQLQKITIDEVAVT